MFLFLYASLVVLALVCVVAIVFGRAFRSDVTASRVAIEVGTEDTKPKKQRRR